MLINHLMNYIKIKFFEKNKTNNHEKNNINSDFSFDFHSF